MEGYNNVKDLKNKTFSGLIWTFFDNFFAQGFQFLVGILLARILSPSDFGQIGVITVFIVFAQSFTDSGFGNALIRKEKFDQEDFSTVFYFNIIVSILFYLFIVIFAYEISIYFRDLTLLPLIKSLSLIIVINAFGFVQRILFLRNLDFKIQAKISFISSLFSGAISLFFAYNGFGVFSLVLLSLIRNSMTTLLLWFWSSWQPSLVFKLKVLKDLFGFGGKLFLSSIIDSLYKNIFSIFIARHFSLTDLGFYTRADQFRSIPSENLTGMINRVSFPVLSQLQNDTESLKKAYIKIIRSTMFLSFNMMLLLCAISRPLINVLIGDKWDAASDYLQLLCFVGMLYPLHSLNLNILQVLGKGTIFLKLEIIKKILAIPVILIGFFYGIKLMLFSMFVHSCIALYLNSNWSGKLIDYSIKNQIKDISPSFIFSLILSLPIYFLGKFLPFDFESKLIIQVFSSIILFFIFGRITSNDDFSYLKTLIIEKFKNKWETRK